MKFSIIHPLCLYICIISNPLQAMDNPIQTTQKPIALSETWRRARSGEMTKKEIQRFLKASVLAISYSDNGQDKKVKQLNKLFTQAFYADAIANPFKKQFYGIKFKDKNDELSLLALPDEHYATVLSHLMKFTSIMEFATLAGTDYVLEQAVRKAVALERTPDVQEKINMALVTALDHSSIFNFNRFEIFKKYGVSFNIPLEDGNTLLHRYGIIPQSVLWLLKNTDIDVNKQNNKGDTVAHILASAFTSNTAILVSIFNQFIKKNINPFIRNKKNRTANYVGFTEDCKYSKNYYTPCAILFVELEKIFDTETLSFNPRARFSLLNDRIHSYTYSKMSEVD